MGNSD